MRSPSLAVAAAVAAPLPAAARAIPRRLTLSLATEVGLVAALVAVAVAVRFPNLWQVPELTDEAWEVWWGYEIYRGNLLPLTNITSFNGPLWNYLVAGLFWLTGPNPFSPRLVIMLLGALTLVPTYLLGREIGGPWAGLVAAALLATNAAHVTSNSHIAWSHCMTPLFGTTAFWLLARAVNRRSGPLFVGGAFFAGLAWLTHGTFMFLFPGLAGFVLWRGRMFLRTRWLPLAVFVFLLTYSPMIIYNLTSGFYTIREASAHDRAIGENRGPTPQSYVLRAGTTWATALRLSGGAIDERAGGIRDYLLDPKVWVYGLLGGAGLAAAWRAGQPLPGLIVLSGFLVWPFFDVGLDTLPQNSRYLMPMIPPTFAAIGFLVARWAAAAVEGPRLVLRRLAWVGVALLVAYPLLPLRSYYDRQWANGRVNEVAYSLLPVVSQAIRPDEDVLLDPRINLWSFGGNGAGHRAFRYLFELSGINTDRVLPDRDLREFIDCDSSDLLLMRGMEFRKLGEGTADLERRGIHLSVVAPPGDPSPVFGVYRVQRDPCAGGPSRKERAARREQRAAQREAEMREDAKAAGGAPR